MDYADFPLLVAAGAALMDLRSFRVYNWWVVGAFLGGVILSACKAGPSGLLMSLAGACVPLALLGFLFPLRMMGAGDIKLLMALGSYLGPGAILRCTVAALFLGAFYSLVFLCLTGTLTQRILHFLSFVSRWKQDGLPPRYLEKGEEKGAVLPFAPAILGAILLHRGGVF